MNVQVVNGLGNTYTENGLGNVIVGYNEDFGRDEVRSREAVERHQVNHSPGSHLG